MYNNIIPLHIYIATLIKIKLISIDLGVNFQFNK